MVEVENNVLVHELQLGTQLSQSVHSGRRADFALMLAMLSDDVREHSQFHLPHTETTENEINDKKLRQRFQLPEPTPLAVQDPQEIAKYNQAKLVLEKRLADLHLQNILSPLPLSIRDDASYIESEIINNTSIHCQRRYKKQSDKDKEGLFNKVAQFNAKAWLSGIEKSLLDSPMVTSHSSA